MRVRDPERMHVCRPRAHQEWTSGSWDSWAGVSSPRLCRGPRAATLGLGRLADGSRLCKREASKQTGADHCPDWSQWPQAHPDSRAGVGLRPTPHGRKIKQCAALLFFYFLNLLYLFLKSKFIYLVLAALGLRCCAWAFSLVAASGGCSSLWCTGFSLQWLLLLQSTGSRLAGFSSCGTWAQ